MKHWNTTSLLCLYCRTVHGKCLTEAGSWGVCSFCLRFYVLNKDRYQDNFTSRAEECPSVPLHRFGVRTGPGVSIWPAQCAASAWVRWLRLLLCSVWPWPLLWTQKCSFGWSGHWGPTRLCSFLSSIFLPRYNFFSWALSLVWLSARTGRGERPL